MIREGYHQIKVSLWGFPALLFEGVLCNMSRCTQVSLAIAHFFFSTWKTIHEWAHLYIIDKMCCWLQQFSSKGFSLNWTVNHLKSEWTVSCCARETNWSSATCISPWIWKRSETCCARANPKTLQPAFRAKVDFLRWNRYNEKNKLLIKLINLNVTVTEWAHF